MGYPLYSLLLVGQTASLVILLALYLKNRQRFGKLDRLAGTTRRTLAQLEQNLESLALAQREHSSNLNEFPALLRNAHKRTRATLADETIQAGYLQALSTLYPGFPVFMGGPALDGHSARVLFDKIECERPKVILELGSGASTVMIAAVLDKLGMHDTRHIAVDNSQHYLDITKRNLARYRFKTATEFWSCPLEKEDETEPAWYSKVKEKLKDVTLDLVLIDGPPGFLHKRSREPALDVIYKSLSRDAVVILDDAARPNEKAIVKRWSEKYPEFHVTQSHRGKGFAVFHRKAPSFLE